MPPSRNVALKKYQTEALDDLSSWFTSNVNCGSLNVDRFALLKAPTGSGKTVVLARLIEEQCSKVVTLWLSPGKGDLEEQSLRSLESMLEGTELRTARLNANYLTANPSSQPGTVLVANWESIVGKKKVMTRSSESMPTLFDHLRRTAGHGTEVVLVVDEGHYGGGWNPKKADSAIAKFVQELTDALGYEPARLEATATPAHKPADPLKLSKGIQKYCEVSVDDVVAAGMLTKSIAFNWGLEEQLATHPEEEVAGVTGEQLVMEAAWARLEQLRTQFNEANSPVRPLLLVQLPNSSATNDTAKRQQEFVEEFLAEQGVTKNNGKLMVWLSPKFRSGR